MDHFHRGSGLHGSDMKGQSSQTVNEKSVEMTVDMVTVATEQMRRTIIVPTRGPRVVKVQTLKESKGSPWRKEIGSEERWRSKDGGYGFIRDPVIQGSQTL